MSNRIKIWIRGSDGKVHLKGVAASKHDVGSLVEHLLISLVYACMFPRDKLELDWSIKAYNYPPRGHAKKLRSSDRTRPQNWGDWPKVWRMFMGPWAVVERTSRGLVGAPMGRIRLGTKSEKTRVRTSQNSRISIKQPKRQPDEYSLSLGRKLMENWAIGWDGQNSHYFISRPSNLKISFGKNYNLKLTQKLYHLLTLYD